MNTSADLLIELGTEELPPKALSTLSQHFTARCWPDWQRLASNTATVRHLRRPGASRW